MLIYWSIRYLDRSDKTFKDRNLFLDTTTLPPANMAAVDLLADSMNHKNERDFLKFKPLFIVESRASLGEEPIEPVGKVKAFSLSYYFEDETGKEITSQEMGQILTGSPTAILVPSGTNQTDLDYVFAEPEPTPLANVILTIEETRLLGYFVRDLREVQDSALMKDGPGTISSGGPALPSGDYYHQTAVTDDEIRSFVTIFRRLYMANEPANLLKAAELFAKSLGDHPLGKWVNGVASEYKSHLEAVPDFRPFMQGTTITFSVKRLIDVFLYTQYAHQPAEDRQRQFTECLRQVGGQINFLTWLFLNEIWKCGLEIGNAGRPIAEWFERYCDHHAITPDVLDSLQSEHAGLGTAEKDDVREARLFREKAEELAITLWIQAGEPEGGPVQFQMAAEESLRRALDGDNAGVDEESA